MTLEPDLLTPAFVLDEVEHYEGLIVEKSGMEPDRVDQFIDFLVQSIEVVLTGEFYPAIERADAAIGDTDPDDVLYVACAIVNDAAIWSDYSDFDEQSVTEAYTTSDVITSFDTVQLDGYTDQLQAATNDDRRQQVSEIVLTLSDALDRLEYVAYSLENERDKQTYGVDFAIAKQLIFRKELEEDRTTVVLIREQLGYQVVRGGH